MPLYLGRWKLDNFYNPKLAMNKKLTDCYFYYYSHCRNGDKCHYRHEPAALGHEVMCSRWLESRCFNVHCNNRHMRIDKKRDQIPCYWESTPDGCSKAYCVFLHTKPRTISKPQYGQGENTQSLDEQQGEVGLERQFQELQLEKQQPQLEVEQQLVDFTSPNLRPLPLYNIIADFNPYDAHSVASLDGRIINLTNSQKSTDTDGTASNSQSIMTENSSLGIEGAVATTATTTIKSNETSCNNETSTNLQDNNIISNCNESDNSRDCTTDVIIINTSNDKHNNCADQNNNGNSATTINGDDGSCDENNLKN